MITKQAMSAMREEFTKLAVSLKELRLATKHLAPERVRVDSIMRAFSDSPTAARSWDKVKNPEGVAQVIESLKTPKGEAPAVLQLRGNRKLPGASPRAKEIEGRTGWLHEGRERREILRTIKNKGTPEFERFQTHHNLAPPLQDLNIAATLKGPNRGKGGAGHIRDMRKAEIEELQKMFPSSFGRLDLGKERLSRHAIKRLNQIHTRAVAPGGTVPIETLRGISENLRRAK